MVDDDEGNPNYDQIRGTTVVSIGDGYLKNAMMGVPGVVYMTAPNVVVRGEYYAHILLTEQPHENTFTVIVDGGQGTAGDPEWLRSVSPEELTGDIVSWPTVRMILNLRPGIPGGYSQGNGWDTVDTVTDIDGGWTEEMIAEHTIPVHTPVAVPDVMTEAEQ